MATTLADSVAYTPPEEARPPAEPWHPAKRIGFRFLFAYFALFCVTRLLGFVPIVGQLIVGGYFVLTRWAATWSASHIVHRPAVFAPTGSGDTMIQWITFGIELTAAAIAAIVWTIVAKRTEYRRLNEWLRIGLRFTLAFIMFGYGFAKILPNQFPAATLERLSEPLGEFSPMGLLWTFMGYSVGYNFFTGMGEAVGGLLLCFRRTTTAGALLLIAVLSNVVLLNYAYDVPVKLYSSIYLIMAIILVAPDARRLIDMLVLNRPTEPRDLRMFATPRMQRASNILRGIFVAYVVLLNFGSNVTRYRTSTNGPLPALYGIYDVQSLVKNGVQVPLVVTDASLWRRIVFSRFDRMSIRTMSDSVSRYTVKIRSGAFTATPRFDSTQTLAFTFQKPSADRLVLTGRVGSDSVVATLNRVDESKYLLNSRGFNCVQEQPFNR